MKIKKIAKMFSLLLILSCIMVVNASNVPEIEATYDMLSNRLSVDVDIDAAGKKMVYVLAVPTDVTAYTLENFASDDRVVIRTFSTDENADIDFKFVMPNDFNGRYNLIINADGTEKSLAIVDIANDQSETLLSKFRAGEYSASDAIENSLTTDIERESIASFVEKNFSSITDDPMSAIKVYMSGEAIAYIMSGRLSMGEALVMYKDYMEMYSGDITYAQDFEKLTALEQAKLEEYIFKNGTDDAFDKVYDTSKFMAQYINASSDTYIKEISLPRLQLSHPELYEEYIAIGNSGYQYEVFSGMYEQRRTVTDYDSVAISFKKNIEIQKEIMNNKTSDDNSFGGFGGGGGGNGGGGSAVSSGIIGLSPVDTAVPSVFSDIDGHWAKTSIENMYSKGIINGFADGTFRPSQNVTRAEFAKMIAVMLNLDTSSEANFADVTSDSWYSGHVAAVAKAGFVKGYEGKFNPEMYITRQDAAVILARVLTYKGISHNSETANFKDEAIIADYAMDSVNRMSALGIITGYNGCFAPLDNTTRAETTALLERVANLIN